MPDYPAAARKEGIEGTVVLSIVVDTEGRVVRATVVKGLGHGLDQAAVEAAKATLWHPATVGGRPTQSTRRFHVRFTLEV
ncbi:MAG: energy transducer TonB [Myxococcales bacterium]|nr:energy transducer TonB [Myxococcales bacterium]